MYTPAKKAVELDENEAVLLEGLVLFLTFSLDRDLDNSAITLVKVQQLAVAFGPDRIIELTDRLAEVGR